MDKETLSNYGWIVICVLVLAVMIALATPFGTFVSDAIKSTTQGLFDVNQNALNSTGLINIDGQTFGEGGNGGTGETPHTPETPETPTEPEENVTYASTFADNTWEQIIHACQNNAVPENWKVGDKKVMVIDGKDVEITIIGKNHDTYADGSGIAPLTFQTGIVEKHTMNSSPTNAGGWTNSSMRSYLNSQLINKIDSNIGSQIKAVTKITNIGYVDAGNKLPTSTNICTTSDKLFLLSIMEIDGEQSSSKYGKDVSCYNQEGKQYDFYIGNSSREQKYQGQTTGWWLRTPYHDYNINFSNVNNYGNIEHPSSTYALGVSFGFCF